MSLVCQPCLRKHGREARCRWTSRSVGNGDIARDHIKYLESRIEELARREVDDPGSSSTQGENLETSPLSRTRPEAGNLDDGQANFLNISAVPAKRKRSASYLDDPLKEFSATAKSPSQHLESSPRKEESHPAEVNAMMGAMPDGPHEQGFFGSSSAANFIKQVKRIIDAKVRSSDDHRQENLDVGNENQFVSRVERRRKRDVQVDQESGLDYVLPTRKTADSLMNLYWELVYPLYPFVDKEGICTVYQSLWQSDGPIYDEPNDLCVLNIIFALACQLSPNIKLEKRKASAEVYFRRATHLLNYDMWQIGSFQLVQCLLIFGQYLQSSNNPHQCWMVIGVAARTAQSLGLHLPETSAQIRSPRRQQLARKVWYGCVLMDTILSMTYGRPTMIESRAVTVVPLPLAIDDQYLSRDTRSGNAQPKGQPATMAFYVQALLLNKILHDILRAFYKPSATVDTEVYETWFRTGPNQSGERSFLELDRALTLWSNSLPSHLVPGQHIYGTEIHLRQANVLRQRSVWHFSEPLFTPGCAAQTSLIISNIWALSSIIRVPKTLHELPSARARGSTRACITKYTMLIFLILGSYIHAYYYIGLYCPDSYRRQMLTPAAWPFPSRALCSRGWLFNVPSCVFRPHRQQSRTSILSYLPRQV
jgi:hypothetical protein